MKPNSILMLVCRLAFRTALATLLLVGCGSSEGGAGGSGGSDLCSGNPCDDGNDCTTDKCDVFDGSCTNTALADDSFCEEGYCQAAECEPIASIFPCTEAGILDAIEAGGGPHGFSCSGPKLIETDAEIVIDNDVILDGRDLKVDAGQTHRVFSVTESVTAELRRFTLRHGVRTEAEIGGGGGIYNQGTLGLLNCTVSDNEAPPVCDFVLCIDGFGGGILNDGTMTITNSTISTNTATGQQTAELGGGYGGGISNEGTLTLANSTVSSNSAHRRGGGIANGRGPTLLGATLTVNNSTVSGNTVTSLGGNSALGGGIWNEGELTVASTTFSTNSAITRGDSLAGDRGTMTVMTSLLTGDCDATIASNGYNIESPGDTCGFSQETDLVDVPFGDLGIGFLANNGGPTLTHELETGSVAIDFIPTEACVDMAGDPLATDQRGVERPQRNACDVGAFETK